MLLFRGVDGKESRVVQAGLLAARHVAITQGPRLGRTVCVLPRTLLSLSKFFRILNKQTFIFYFSLDPANYVAGPKYSNKVSVISEEQIGLVSGGEISLPQFNFSRCFKMKASHGKQEANASSCLDAVGATFH